MSDLNSVTKDNTNSEQPTKTGRPNNWTSSRLRKLARLYLYSNLPPKDIPQALQEDDWIPRKESTTKTVSSLLDIQPRWLRPKNREEMEKRITALSECKQRRKMLRKLEKLGNYGDTSPRFSNALPSFELTEEPPHELPAFSSEQTINCMTNNETSLRFVSAPVSYNDPTYAGDQDTIEHAETLPSNNLGGPSTYIYIDSLKRRLTKCLSKYSMGISRLLRGLSISGTSATTTIRKPVKYDEATLLDRPRAFITLLDIKTSSTNATFPLPNTLLVIDHCMRRQGICIPSLKLHDSKSCWCAVAEELRSKAKLWVCGTSLTVDVADPPSSLLHLDLTFRDSFGNTALYLLAARGTSLHVMMEAIERVHEVNAVNTAGQTFLHVLHDEFFRDLVYYDIDIMMLLERLDYFNVTFYNCDIFGVNFFHILVRAAKYLNRNLHSALKLLDIKIPSARDTFGLAPSTRVNKDLYHYAISPQNGPSPLLHITSSTSRTHSLQKVAHPPLSYQILLYKV